MYTEFTVNKRFGHGKPFRGGVTILIKKNLDVIQSHKLVPLRTALEAVAVQLVLRNDTTSTSRTLTVCTLYLPGAAKSNSDSDSNPPQCIPTFESLCELSNELPTPFIICADVNGHNPLWGGETIVTDVRGVLVQKWLAAMPDVALLNETGTATFEHHTGKSAIDLTLERNQKKCIGEHLWAT